MENHIGPNEGRKAPKTALWVVSVLVALIVIVGALYFGGVFDRDVIPDTNVVLNTNSFAQNAVSFNSNYKIQLGSEWQPIASNVYNNIFTSETTGGLSLKIVLVDQDVAVKYHTPDEYLDARSFEFSSSYTEMNASTSLPDGFGAAMRVFEYEGGMRSLVAVAGDIGGTLVLIQVNGPSSENIESVTASLFASIQSTK